MANTWITPSVWYILTRVTLAEGDYLLWKLEFAEACKKITKRNAQAGNGWNADMLMGDRNFAAEDVQMQYESRL